MIHNGWMKHVAPSPHPGSLFVVATPIGNLEDMTYRAVRVLGEVDLVAAEDTRHTRIVFDHYGITTPLVALHEHNESAAAPSLIQGLRDGSSLALVSDAGTPLVSDPGYRLVQLAIESGIAVVTIPGPSAVTAALAVAGLPTDRFVFEGFLSARAGARKASLERLRHESRTLVFFESSHRVLESLGDLATVFGEDRPAAVCRELTKRFETVLRGSLASLKVALEADANQRKGEFVLVVGGAEPDADAAMEKAVELGAALEEFLSGSQAARVAAKLCQVDRRELYKRLNPDAT